MHLDGPQTARLGQPVTFVGTMMLTGGCLGNRGELVMTVNEAQREIGIRGFAITEDRTPCGMVSYLTSTATFTPQNTGVYTIRATIHPDKDHSSAYSRYDPPVEPEGRTPVDVVLKLFVTK